MLSRRLGSQSLLPFLSPRSLSYARYYAQQRTSRAYASQSQQSSTSASQPQPHVKAASIPVSNKPKTQTSAGAVVPDADFDEEKAAKVRRFMTAREQQQDVKQMMRLSGLTSAEPWSQKMPLMDVMIPLRFPSFAESILFMNVLDSCKTWKRAIREHWRNNIQNAVSMYRLATEYAFPGKVTNRRFSPQLFKARSTKDDAWIAPIRKDILTVYKKINEAIASGNERQLKLLTAYEYEEHAMELLQRNVRRTPDRSYTWRLIEEIEPVQIVSIRANVLYIAPEEPAQGNRLMVQLTARFETLQELVVRNKKGEILLPDGTPAEKGYTPPPRRVVEYLVFENKMFYNDGWYVRDQMFESMKAKHKMI